MDSDKSKDYYVLPDSVRCKRALDRDVPIYSYITPIRSKYRTIEALESEDPPLELHIYWMFSRGGSHKDNFDESLKLFSWLVTNFEFS
jgi:hypothetical protein